jgi:hypothetical protein
MTMASDWRTVSSRLIGSTSVAEAILVQKRLAVSTHVISDFHPNRRDMDGLNLIETGFGWQEGLCERAGFIKYRPFFCVKPVFPKTL